MQSNAASFEGRFVVRSDGDVGWVVYDRVLGMDVFGSDQRRCAAQFAREHNSRPSMH
jgi:hypothetical protein